MRYKVTIENLVDPTDKFIAEADAAIVFIGQVSGAQSKFEAGMGYVGHKAVLAGVIDTIPAQLQQFAGFINHMAKPAEDRIILPNSDKLKN